MTLAEAIAKQENVNPNYNNPGALTAPLGYCSNGKLSNGLVQFCTPQDGANALQKQIDINTGRGLTLSQFFGGGNGYPGYANAASGNDPVTYTNNISSWTGIPSNVPLSDVLNVGTSASVGDWQGSNNSVDYNYSPDGSFATADILNLDPTILVIGAVGIILLLSRIL